MADAEIRPGALQAEWAGQTETVPSSAVAEQGLTVFDVAAIRRRIHAHMQQLVADVLSGWARWNLEEIDAILGRWDLEPSPKVNELQEQLVQLRIAATYTWVHAKMELLRIQEEKSHDRFYRNCNSG